MKEDGKMARMRSRALSREHDLKILRIAHLIAYRQNERQIRRRAETVLPTRKAGSFRLAAYSDNLETQACLALIKGEVQPGRPTLVRLHSQCLTGDVFGSERCDCWSTRRGPDHVGVLSGVLVYISRGALIAC